VFCRCVQICTDRRVDSPPRKYEQLKYAVFCRSVQIWTDRAVYLLPCSGSTARLAWKIPSRRPLTSDQRPPTMQMPAAGRKFHQEGDCLSAATMAAICSADRIGTWE